MDWIPTLQPDTFIDNSLYCSGPKHKEEPTTARRWK